MLKVEDIGDRFNTLKNHRHIEKSRQLNFCHQYLKVTNTTSLPISLFAMKLLNKYFEIQRHNVFWNQMVTKTINILTLLETSSKIWKDWKTIKLWWIHLFIFMNPCYSQAPLRCRRSNLHVTVSTPRPGMCTNLHVREIKKNSKFTKFENLKFKMILVPF